MKSTQQNQERASETDLLADDPTVSKQYRTVLVFSETIELVLNLYISLSIEARRRIVSQCKCSL